jgi:hypothetical protein
MQDLERYATAIARSGLFGIKTVEQAIALMAVAQAEGRHPGSVALDYNIIQGKPSLKADTILSRFQALGGKVRWTEYSDERVTGVFTHEQGGEVTVTWDDERVKKAGLADRPLHKTHPRAMKRARCVSEGVRACFPAACGGLYTPEEVVDFTAPEIKDTTAVVLSTTTSTPTPPANDAQEAPTSPAAPVPAQSDGAEATTLPAEPAEAQETEKRALKATKKQIEETAALCKTLEASGSLDLQQFREWRKAKYGAEKTADCTREQAKEVFAALVAIRDNGVKGLPF